MAFAIFFISVVFPAFGGATIMPLWPFPIGAMISIILVAIFSGSASSTSLSFGYTGVSLSKSLRFAAVSGLMSFIDFT